MSVFPCTTTTKRCSIYTLVSILWIFVIQSNHHHHCNTKEKNLISIFSFLIFLCTVLFLLFCWKSFVFFSPIIEYNAKISRHLPSHPYYTYSLYYFTFLNFKFYHNFAQYKMCLRYVHTKWNLFVFHFFFIFVWL